MSQEPRGQVGSCGLCLQSWLLCHTVSNQVQLVLSCVVIDLAEQHSVDYRIIGKGGETVRALQSYSGAMIQVTAGQAIT